MTRALFSQSWHSVAELRPRLLTGVRIHRHVYRDQVWYLLQDQAGGRFNRITPAAYDLVTRMDGSRTVQALWDEACQRPDGDIPTQNEVVDLLIQLHAADLLQTNITPDAAALFERYRKRRQQPLKQWLLNPMSLKLPLIDPDAFLARLAGGVNPAFGYGSALIWVLTVLPAAVLAVEHWSELTTNLSDRMLSASNLLVMALVYPVVKALHELGHGFATKFWGGHVHEMGLMFLVFAPVPYVDASAASAFPSKYQRAVVGAAGMLVEVFLAALALYVWLSVEPGLMRAVAFNVMVVAGISTLIVNGNPLMRYDAYYILCDLIEMPNLAQRGQRFLGLLWDHYVFGSREYEASTESAGEKRWLALYTPVSWCYRVFITLQIIVFIAGQFFFFGVMLAAWSAAALVLTPAWKAIQHVRQSPQLQRRRRQAVNISIGLVAAAILLLAVVPAPLHTQAEGVIWLPDRALLRAGTDGIFQRWLVEAGTAVKRGTPVALLEDPLLASELDVARARTDEAAARYRSEQYEHPEKAEIARRQLEQEQRVLARTEERAAQLIVLSESEGVLAADRPQDMPGQFFKKGTLLGYVLESRSYMARVVVRQDDIDLVRSRYRAAELRLAEDIRTVYRATILREMPGGVNELPTAALGPTGGGTIAVDPQDQKGIKALERVFIYDLQLPEDIRPRAFGGRVHVRFDHGYEPLAFQGWRRLRQLFLSRLDV